MDALFACSRCFSRHPFEELSQGQQLCKECRGSFPIVKCTFCRSEFQHESKGSPSTICKKCEANVKVYGKPTACELCNIIAAFIGNKCQRCTNCEKKYGPPVTCDQCKQKCAFDREDEDKKKVDGKTLCWLCTLSYRRALAKTKQDRNAKLAAQTAAKSKEKTSRHGTHQPHLSGHNKRPNRPDVTKVGLGGGDEPPAKLSRPIPRDSHDPNSSDHVVAMTQLREQVAALQKQLSNKDQQLIGKDKQMTELKATQFRTELELRNKIKTMQKDQDAKTQSLQNKIKSLQKEIASLSKRGKPTASGSASNNHTPTITFHKESSNSGVTEGSASAGSGAESP